MDRFSRQLCITLLAALYAAGCDDGAAPGIQPLDAASAGSSTRDATRDAGSSGGKSGAGGAAHPDARVGPAPDAGRASPDAASPRNAPDAHAPTDASVADASPTAEAGTPDASSQPDAGSDDGGARVTRVPGWSVRKRVPRPGGGDLVLEEVLTPFAEALPRANRIQSLEKAGSVERTFQTPDGTYLSDFRVHPSGAVSAVLLEPDRTVSLVRLDETLATLSSSRIHDPLLPGDLPGIDAGVSDLFANPNIQDAARIATVGEDVVAVVSSSVFSVIAYRASFSGGAWSSPARTLIEPPRPLTPLIPIGGSFDTFGAIVAWFRASLDTDADGNAFVAVWANPIKLRAHVATFHDGLTALPAAPGATDSDVLLTRMNRDGKRAWTRVVGTRNEDEPYAVRASHGQVAVVGRSRRATGFDNTFWDAFVSVSTADGNLVGSRAIALDASSIFLAVDALPSGAWVLGGSDGWEQNPDGLSVFTSGAKLLLELSAVDAAPVRRALPPGPRHNEVRTVAAEAGLIRYGGHEDGPIMHTGDADPSQIRATGVLDAVPE